MASISDETNNNYETVRAWRVEFQGRSEYAKACQEYATGEREWSDVLMESNAAGAAVVDEPLPIREGYRIVSDRPGIGVEIDEELIAQYVYKPVPITGHFHADGSVAH